MVDSVDVVSVSTKLHGVPCSKFFPFHTSEAFAKLTQGRRAKREDHTPFTAAQASLSWNLGREKIMVGR